MPPRRRKSETLNSFRATFTLTGKRQDPSFGIPPQSGDWLSNKCSLATVVLQQVAYCTRPCKTSPKLKTPAKTDLASAASVPRHSLAAPLSATKKGLHDPRPFPNLSACPSPSAGSSPTLSGFPSPSAVLSFPRLSSLRKGSTQPESPSFTRTEPTYPRKGEGHKGGRWKKSWEKRTAETLFLPPLSRQPNQTTAPPPSLVTVLPGLPLSKPVPLAFL